MNNLKFKTNSMTGVDAGAHRVALTYLRSIDGSSFDAIKNIMRSIPGAASIRNKDDALKIVWDFVKKIGADKVLETLSTAEKALSTADRGQRLAEVNSTLGWYLKSTMYPLLFLAAVLLYMFVGKPQIEHLKQQIRTVQNQEISAINDIGR